MPVSRNRKKKSNVQRIAIYKLVRGGGRGRKIYVKLIGYKFITHLK